MNKRILAWMFAIVVMGPSMAGAEEAVGPVPAEVRPVETGMTLAQTDTAAGAQNFMMEGNLAVAAALAFVTLPPPAAAAAVTVAAVPPPAAPPAAASPPPSLSALKPPPAPPREDRSLIQTQLEEQMIRERLEKERLDREWERLNREWERLMRERAIA